MLEVLWLKDLLLGPPTPVSDYEYGMLRRLLLADRRVGSALPDFVRQCATLKQFRALLDNEIPDDQARERYVREQFRPLFAELEIEPSPNMKNRIPA
jgi:hypothetical protein